MIDVTTDYVLENDKVLLRPLQAADYENLLPFAINEPDLWFFSLVSAAGAEGMEKYIQEAVVNRHQQKEYPWIVFDKLQQQYAGCTRFYDINSTFNTVQLGYTWYGSKFHGTGLNKNCKYLLFQFAFETWKVERLELRADNDNARSIAAMKSVGAKVDGILRANMPKPTTGRRDSIVLSILKNEWFGEVKEMLAKKIM